MAAVSADNSRNFAGADLRAPQQPLQRDSCALGQMADPLALRQLLPDLFRPDASVHPCNEKMIKYIGALADQTDAVTCYGLD